MVKVIASTEDLGPYVVQWKVPYGWITIDTLGRFAVAEDAKDAMMEMHRKRPLYGPYRVIDTRE